MDINYSIVIPHYNNSKRLHRLLDSLPKREDMQVIVVDDCSPDTSELEKIKGLFPDIEFYSTDTNQGGGKARNIGLDKARGKFVIFSDSDDFFLPSLDSLLDEYVDSEYDIIFFNAVSLRDSDFSLSNRSVHLNRYIELNKKNPDKASLSLRYLFGEPWCKIIRRDIITGNDIRFQECRVHNDTYFSYMVGYHAKYISISRTVSYVVIDRPNSVSKNASWKRAELLVDTFAKKNRFMSDHNIPVFDCILIGPFIRCVKKLNIKEFKKLKTIMGKYGYSTFDIMMKLISNKFLIWK